MDEQECGVRAEQNSFSIVRFLTPLLIIVLTMYRLYNMWVQVSGMIGANSKFTWHRVS